MIDFDMSISVKSEFYSIIEACSLVETTKDFKAIFKKINHLLGQEMTAYGVGDTRTMAVISNLNIGFSKNFMASIVNASGQMTSPLFQRWLRCQNPQVLDFTNRESLPSADNLALYRDFPLQNIISHGVVDYSQRYVSYFDVANIPEKIGAYLPSY